MNKPAELEELKKNLAQSVSTENVDFDQILRLSNEIIKYDQSKVRFSTDAGIIDRLGKELVGRQETAVSELVKNAFDADATCANLTFINFQSKGGALIIKDNGAGMTREELINGFMRLSSGDKIENPHSHKYWRKRAGRKGIGRFAAQRLGKNLTIITQSEKSEKSLRIEIDWTRFTTNAELNSVSSVLKELPKGENTGTTLIIDFLEDAWTEAAIKRIYRYLIELIQPFPLSAMRSTSNSMKENTNEIAAEKISVLNDPGFEINIYKQENNKTVAFANTEQDIYAHALAEIEGVVGQGQGIWSVKSTRLGIDEVGTPFLRDEKPYNYLNNVHFKAYYFIVSNVDYYSRPTAAFLKEFLKERGGIRIYRNGFRVLPYGEAFNDWLRLDYNYGRRYVLPPFSNENFYGFIEITDADESTFQETSSREGLIENAAYNELVDFVFKSLKGAAFRIAEARERKKTASQKDGWKDKTPSEKIAEAVDELKKIADDVGQADERNEKVNSNSKNTSKKRILGIIERVTEAGSEQEEAQAQLIEENSLLRVLANLGLSIGIFTHEVKHLYGSILADSTSITRTASLEQKKAAERLDTHIKSFRTYTSYFDNIVSENVHRELRIQDIASIAREFVKIMRPAANRYSVVLHEPTEETYDVFSCKMHWSECISILLNLFSNALKAIKRARTSGEIMLWVGKKDEYVFLDFFDNGDGIPPENRERIFEPFFTTSSAAGPLAGDSDELLGSGLGLKIVKDIVESYNGKIRLIEPTANYVTCFRIQLPQATKSEIKEYGY